MATKDWNKDKYYPNLWNNITNRHAITILEVSREPSQPRLGKWVCKHANGTYWIPSRDKYFKTKTDALKYAKAYMRKN